MSEFTWDEALKNYEKAVKNIEGLMVQYNAVCSEYAAGKLSDLEYYEKFLPVLLTLLENYTSQAVYSDALIKFDSELIADLEKQIKLHEKFLRKFGLSHKFNDFSDRRRGLPKLKNVFRRQKF